MRARCLDAFEEQGVVAFGFDHRSAGTDVTPFPAPRPIALHVVDLAERLAGARHLSEMLIAIGPFGPEAAS